MNFKQILSKGDLTYIVSIAALIIMPLHIQYLPPFMILWGIFWIFENNLRFNVIMVSGQKSKMLFALFIVYYIWQVAGLIYSADIKMGLSNLFSRLSLVLFPLVLIFPGDMIKSRGRILLRTFALSTFLFMIFCFCFALYRSVHIQDGSWNFNPHLPEYPWLSYFYGSDLVVTQHPSYIAMYVLLSVLICFEAWFDYSLKYWIRIRWLLIGLLLLISQYFLSSRAGILISLVLIPFYFMRKFRKHQRKRFAWIGIILLILILLPLIVKNWRVGSLYNSFFNEEQANKESREGDRLIIWKSALTIARQNSIFGIGIGDVRTELTRQYEKIGEEKLAKEKFNAHNQFLEVLLENGIIGLLIFISIFLVMAYIAIVDKNLLFGMFIMMIFMFFLFETVLYRLAGVSFFSLFTFLLIHIKNDKQLEI